MSPYWLSDHHSIECDWSINPGKGQSRPIIAGTSTSLPGVNTFSDDRNLLKNSIIFYSLFFSGRHASPFSYQRGTNENDGVDDDDDGDDGGDDYDGNDDNDENSHSYGIITFEEFFWFYF